MSSSNSIFQVLPAHSGFNNVEASLRQERRDNQNTERTSCVWSSTRAMPSFIDLNYLHHKSLPRPTNVEFQGGNAVKIHAKLKSFQLPRTLYMLLATCASIQLYYNAHRAKPGFNQRIMMNTIEEVKFPERNPWIEMTQEELDASIITYLEELGFCPNKEVKWQQIVELLEKLFANLISYKEKIKLDVENGEGPFVNESGERILAKHIYEYFLCDDSAQQSFQETILNSIQLEWFSPSSKVVLYRGSDCGRDDIITDQDPERSHSLSFNTSPLAGIVFEGFASGTCPLIYHVLSAPHLIALCLDQHELESFFYYPNQLRDITLYSLNARGEFSHPRIKYFQLDTQHSLGVAVVGSDYETDQQFARCSSREQESSTFWQYRDKLRELFKQNAVLIHTKH